MDHDTETTQHLLSQIPDGADLVTRNLADELASHDLPELAEQLRLGQLVWHCVAELFAFLLGVSIYPRTPRLEASFHAAQRMDRGDVVGAIERLAAAADVTPAVWALWQRMEQHAPTCAQCGGHVDPAAPRSICDGCREEVLPRAEEQPEPEPPAPAPKRRHRKVRPGTLRVVAGPTSTKAPAAPAALLAAAGAVGTPEAAVAWWSEQLPALAQLDERGRRAVRKALAVRVSQVGGAGLRSRAAAEGWLRSRLARVPSATATAGEPSRDVPSHPEPSDTPSATATASTLAVVPAPALAVVDEQPDAETVLSRFADALLDVTRPAEALALWLRSREQLPPGARTEAMGALCNHLEVNCYTPGASRWMRKALTDHDAAHAVDAASPLAGAA